MMAPVKSDHCNPKQHRVDETTTKRVPTRSLNTAFSISNHMLQRYLRYVYNVAADLDSVSTLPMFPMFSIVSYPEACAKSTESLLW